MRQKFTGYERDETELDFAGARYYASVQGRFTSPDPIYFQASMMTDPQIFNLYAYVRNNPLRLIDPGGEAIRLSDDEEQRKEELFHLKVAVGEEAGRYLYANPVEIKDKDGNVIGTEYYVGIYTNGPDGEGPAFDQINEVAGEFAAVINDTKVLDFKVVGRTSILFDEGKGFFSDTPTEIGSLAEGRNPGAVGHINGRLTTVVYEGKPGVLPKEVMEDGKPSISYSGSVVGHEIGHARDRMTGRDPFLMGLDAGSLRIENKVRKLHDPTAARRVREQ